MRLLVLVLTAVLIGSILPANAQYPPGRWMLDPDGTKSTVDPGVRVGKLKLGSTRAEVETLLGAPYQGRAWPRSWRHAVTGDFQQYTNHGALGGLLQRQGVHRARLPAD